MTHHRRTVTAPQAPAAVGAYSHAVASKGLVFCSGQVPLDPDTGELIDGDIAAMTTRCLESLQAVCEAAGTTIADAVRLTIYLTDLPGDWGDVNEAYEAFVAGSVDYARVVLETKRGSVSLLQRRLTIGYSRASRLIEQMAQAGILGDYKGSQAREVNITAEQWEAMKAQVAADQEAGMTV